MRALKSRVVHPDDWYACEGKRPRHGRGWGGGAAFEIARDSTLPVNQTRPAQTLYGGADT